MSNNYVSISDFDNRFDTRVINQLSTSDDTANPVALNIQTAIDDAASLWDSYFLGRFVVSTGTPTPNIIQRWICIKALDNMFGRRMGMPDWIIKEMDWADKFLEDLVMGKALIPGTARATMPTLQDSENFCGRSRGDRPVFFDDPPTPTSTSHGRR